MINRMDGSIPIQRFLKNSSYMHIILVSKRWGHGSITSCPLSGNYDRQNGPTIWGNHISEWEFIKENKKVVKKENKNLTNQKKEVNKNLTKKKKVTKISTKKKVFKILLFFFYKFPDCAGNPRVIRLAKGKQSSRCPPPHI